MTAVWGGAGGGRTPGVVGGRAGRRTPRHYGQRPLVVLAATDAFLPGGTARGSSGSGNSYIVYLQCTYGGNIVKYLYLPRSLTVSAWEQFIDS